MRQISIALIFCASFLLFLSGGSFIRILNNMTGRYLFTALICCLILPGVFLTSCKKEKAACTDQQCRNALIDSAANTLIALINKVSAGDSVSFQTKDDQGNTMDCAKIIAYRNDTFIAVYHTYDGAKFNAHLAISTDLLHWTHKYQMGTHASQPTIYQTENKKFVAAWEQDPNNHIRILWFDNFDRLLSNQNSGVKDIAHTLSLCAEGTPNIYAADDTHMDIGFHYWRNCDVDRQARGTLVNFSSWSKKTETQMDSALLKFDLHGNIGDRDDFVYRNFPFIIIEGQKTKNDFGTWDLFLYSSETAKAYPFRIQTPLAASSFGNPTVSILPFHNKEVLLVTAFIFSGGPEGAEMIYYKFI